MKSYKVVGVMSGTSLDGMDLALCTFSKKGARWNYSITAATTIEYTEDQKRLFHSLMNATAEELAFADAEFGRLIGKSVKKFLASKRLKADFISSHGHTIFHQPSRLFTYQLGSGAAIQAESDLPVICDFRSTDVALKGQGAPLVPIGDALLFNKYHYCLNLGGISNISFELKNKRVAFDISPVNIVLNALAKQVGMEYDEGGKLASEGVVQIELLNALNRLEFYKLKFPKSLGREWVDKEIFPLLEKSSVSVEDKLATFCEHIAVQLAAVIQKAGNKSKTRKKLLVTGGGAFNTHLINRFKEKLEGIAEVVVPDKNTVMFKEALIFAFLGVLRLRNEANALRSVTGATKDSISGALYGKIPG